MDAKERVGKALDFERPDRMPLYDSYWPEFIENWRAVKNAPASADIADDYENDVEIVIPLEAPFPSRACLLQEDAAWRISRDAWGVTERSRAGAHFSEILQVALPDKTHLEQLEFESPLLDLRYPPRPAVEALKAKRCVFIKTGGPYLRTSNLRGGAQWLIDLVEDPAFALELAMKVTRHITAVGLEALRRYDLYDTGIWFFDDMGSNRSPMFSPRTFERIFYPCYRWMCAQYRAAGVKRILLHCDGNIENILDMLIEAGINAFHPVEPKAGMDVVRLRERYGRKLAFLGGLDNAHILPGAPLPELEAHVRRVLEVGRDGGLVIGAHSIGPDISVERYDFVHQLIRRYGQF